MFSFANIIFKYLSGPLKKASDICMNKDPKLKKRLNLPGEIKIKGKKVKAKRKKRHPTPKKAPNA